MPAVNHPCPSAGRPAHERRRHRQGDPRAAAPRRLLIGQPTLRRMLRLGVLAALDQRIALRYAMPAMTPEQTAGYITHHLKLAGRSDPCSATTPSR
jgi:type II secretory pathway predicted ATPase ExeA